MSSRLRMYKAKHVEKTVADKALHFVHDVFHSHFHSAIGLTFVAFVALTFMSIVGFSTSDYLNESLGPIAIVTHKTTEAGIVKGISISNLVPVAQAAESCPTSALPPTSTGITCQLVGNQDKDLPGTTDPDKSTERDGYNGIPNEPAFNLYKFTNAQGKPCYQAGSGSYSYVQSTPGTMPPCSGTPYIARDEMNIGAAMRIDADRGVACFDRYNGDGTFQRTVCQPAALGTRGVTGAQVASFKPGIYNPCAGKPAGTNGCFEFNPMTGKALTKQCRIGAYEADSTGAPDLTKPLDLLIPDCAKVDEPFGFSPPVGGVNTPTPVTAAVQGGCYYQYSLAGTAPQQLCFNANGTPRQPNINGSAGDQLSFAVGQLMLEPFGEITSSNASGVEGWAVNPQSLTTPLELRVYIKKDGSQNEEFAFEATADISRPDIFTLDAAVKMGVTATGFSNHGFKFALPTGTKVGDRVTVYAVKPGGGWNPLIDSRTVVAGSGTSEAPAGRGNPGRVLTLIFSYGQPIRIPTAPVTSPGGTIKAPSQPVEISGGGAYRPYGPEDPACVRMRQENTMTYPRVTLLYTYGQQEGLSDEFQWKYVGGSAPTPTSTITLTVGAIAIVKGKVVIDGPNGFHAEQPVEGLEVRNNCYYSLTGHNVIHTSPITGGEGSSDDRAKFQTTAGGTYTAVLYDQSGGVLARDEFSIFGGPPPAPAPAPTVTPPPAPPAAPVNYSFNISPNPAKVCSATETATVTVTGNGPNGAKLYHNSSEIGTITNGSSVSAQVSIGYNSSTPLRLYKPDGGLAAEANLTSSAAGC